MNKRFLLPVVLLLFMLQACNEPSMESVNKVGEVEIGFFGTNAVLTEVCLDNTPYYLLISTIKAGKPGTKSSLAVRYEADGSIPTCSTSFETFSSAIEIQRIGHVPPDRNVGVMCIDSVTYIFVDDMYSAGMAERRTAGGQVISCNQ